MTQIFVLILFAHVGPQGHTNANAIATQEFTSAQKCQIAGEKSAKLVSGSIKRIDFVCVEK